MRKNDMSGGGGWQARRECIEELLGPTKQALEDLQEAEYEAASCSSASGMWLLCHQVTICQRDLLALLFTAFVLRFSVAPEGRPLAGARRWRSARLR
ncbi:hypothetical protein [Streptomyces swartbergensis]|uniref:hypothetical protein n=1 Tax=Streptomyces swartbergensis TaxID=487165 RepID=UPI0038041AAE